MVLRVPDPGPSQIVSGTKYLFESPTAYVFDDGQVFCGFHRGRLCCRAFVVEGGDRRDWIQRNDNEGPTVDRLVVYVRVFDDQHGKRQA